MIRELIYCDYFWGVAGSIAGVILGFLLGEGSGWLRYRMRIRRLKRLIKDELNSILKQLPLKKDVVNQIIQALNNGRYIPGHSVSIMNTGYKQHFSELYEHLSKLQRNCLHVIHETLDVAEKTLSSFETDFLAALEKGLMDNPFGTYKGRFEEVNDSYQTVEDLIRSYLDGKPIDVFYLKAEKSKSNGADVTRRIHA